MKNIIIAKIKDLEAEVNSIIDNRKQLVDSINELDIRMHQIVGALGTLQDLIKGDHMVTPEENSTAS